MLTEVLIVDDEQVALTTMSMILRSDHTVTTASSAQDAIEKFVPGKFAVVVCDFKMPGDKNGIDVLEHVANHDPSCARILLTAYGNREAIIDAINRGKIYLYLDKPCEPSRLQMAVRRAAEHWSLEQERRTLIDRLSTMEKVAAVGRFASGVGHDIKNYLVPLLVAAEENDPSEMADALSTAQKASEHILALVNEMTALARGGRPSYTMYPSSVSDLVLDSARWVKRLPVAAHRQIEVDAPDDITVNMSQGSLRRVFINLFKNGLEAMPDGSNLKVRAKQQQGSVFITIEDTGLGMTPEVVESCFQPFYSTKGDAGTGLGLYICRTIIAGHGGSITVDSVLGQGTTFTVKLPTA